MEKRSEMVDGLCEVSKSRYPDKRQPDVEFRSGLGRVMLSLCREMSGSRLSGYLFPLLICQDPLLF